MPTTIATKRASYQISEFKAVGALGEFTAIVSVFGNVDLVGDRVMSGAFKNSLARWKASGDPIPVIWSHDWDDPFAHIGVVTAASETAVGLQIAGKLDIDKPFAKQVYDLLVTRRVKEWSFAYDIFDEARAKDGANELRELGLIEVGPTLKGANPETETIAAKALLAAKEGEAAMADDLKSISGRKVYVDAELPGSFDETRETVRDAVTALLNPTNDEGIYVWVQAMFPTYALIEVCRDGEDDETYRITWTADGDDAVTLGTPEAVDITVTVEPKSAKSGRRVSQSTYSEMQARHAAYAKALDALSTAHDAHSELLSTFANATDAEGEKTEASTAYTVRDLVDQLKTLGLLADDDRVEGFKGVEHTDRIAADELRRKIEASETATDDDREPQAKSDPEWLALRTRVLEARATTGATP